MNLKNEKDSLVTQQSREWVRVRKQLYEQVKDQVLARLDDAQSSLKEFEIKYEKELSKKWTSSTKRDLIASIINVDFLLMGDFHALQQSQRSHLRILKELFAQGRKVVLGVEFIFASHQHILDLYLNGKISEKKFLVETKWDEHWGFPWEHFKPLMEWAKENKVKVFGLNRRVSHKSNESLFIRDEFATKVLTDIKTNNPDSIVVAIYGELHLTTELLPNHLKKRNKSTRIGRIFQNSEKIYFQLALSGKENRVDVVKLGPFDFCVFSVPPWVKWQNYLLFLEKTYDQELDEENLIDCTDHVHHLVSFLAKELKVKIDASELSVYTSEEPDFFDKIQSGLPRNEFIEIKNLVRLERSFYLPTLKIAYLGRLSVNHAASVASEYLHAQISGRKRICLNTHDDFLRQIWIQALNYFGTKLINHKRKTDTIEDIKRSLSIRDEKSEKGKDALLLALRQKVREVSFLSTGVKPKIPIRARLRLSYWEASRLLGGMMGERLYNSFRKGQISTELIEKLLRHPVDQEGFDEFYFEIVELIESLPSFRSKSERL